MGQIKLLTGPMRSILRFPLFQLAAALTCADARQAMSCCQLATFLLITSWNFVGCSIGSSFGFAPRKILSTYAAARIAVPRRSMRVLLPPFPRLREASHPYAALRRFGLVLLGFICLDEASGQSPTLPHQPCIHIGAVR